MKIAIDISNLHSWSKQRGIGFYTNYLFNALTKYSEEEILLVDNNKEKIGVDLIHFPFFDLFKATLPLIKKCPMVVTIHDVIPLVFPEHYPAGVRGQFNLIRQKISLHSVDAVITDSNSSKKDISKILNVNSEKIFTIYLAPSEHFKIIKDKKKLITIRNKYNLPESFVLYVGNVNWNKNLLNLAKACVESNKELVMIGKGFETMNDLSHPELSSYAKFLKEFSRKLNIHILGFVSDIDLVAIYNLAEATLLPSFYEGFGLPILESQACGTPVITSKTSSMVEVSGGSTILIDPYKPEELRDALISLSDEKKRDQLKSLGFQNLKRFSWKKVAEETLNVYKKVIQEKA